MEEKMAQIPFVAHEGSLTRMERIIKRLVAALVVSIILTFASNALWLYAWLQYDYTGETSTITVDSKDGIANYIGNDGDITNGKDSGAQSDKSTDKSGADTGEQ